MNRTSYWRNYKLLKRETINARRRERYATDTVFRATVLATSRRWATNRIRVAREKKRECIDCGRLVSDKAYRCVPCRALYMRIQTAVPKKSCVQCGQEIGMQATRCRGCYQRLVRLTPQQKREKQQRKRLRMRHSCCGCGSLVDRQSTVCRQCWSFACAVFPHGHPSTTRVTAMFAACREQLQPIKERYKWLKKAKQQLVELRKLHGMSMAERKQYLTSPTLKSTPRQGSDQPRKGYGPPFALAA